MAAANFFKTMRIDEASAITRTTSLFRMKWIDEASVTTRTTSLFTMYVLLPELEKTKPVS